MTSYDHNDIWDKRDTVYPSLKIYQRGVHCEEVANGPFERLSGGWGDKKGKPPGSLINIMVCRAKVYTV